MGIHVSADTHSNSSAQFDVESDENIEHGT